MKVYCSQQRHEPGQLHHPRESHLIRKPFVVYSCAKFVSHPPFPNEQNTQFRENPAQPRENVE